MFDIRKSQTSFLPDTILSTSHMCGHIAAVTTGKGQNMICKYLLRSLSQ